jgi:hypothetical protein
MVNKYFLCAFVSAAVHSSVLQYGTGSGNFNVGLGSFIWVPDGAGSECSLLTLGGGLLLLVLSLGGGGVDGGDGGSLLGVSGGHDLGVSGEAELLDEVLDTSVGEEVVVPSPVVDLVEESS